MLLSYLHKFLFVGVLLAIGAVAQSSSVSAQTPRYALIIGNSNYDNATRLPNPANDAELMAGTLEGLGFRVFKYIDLDQKNMRRAIRDFGEELEKAGEDVVSLVYYSGHGIQVNGQNFLIPTDAEIKAERDVAVESVPADAVLAMLGYSETNLNIVILDACRNNPFQKKYRSAGGNGLARMDAPSGTILAYSTAPGKVAADGDGRNSPYTRALARSMNRPGTPVEEMFKRVRVEVMDRTNDQQVPWESSSLTGSFYFAGGETPTASSTPSNTETVFWTSIVTETDPALFETYLKQYPDGVFAPIARTRIASLGELAKTGSSDRAATSSLQPDMEEEMRFVPGEYAPDILSSRSDCIDVRFEKTDAEEKDATGFWRHPETRGNLKYEIDEDGIVSVKMTGSGIRSVKDTVQIRGPDLYVKLVVYYGGGSCKVAYLLRGIMAVQ